MSKWGIEEKETLDAINKIGFKGKILNIAAGDGRFNEELLKIAEGVVAIDISKEDLEELETKCPKELRGKLNTKCIDITKKLPFKEDSFDGIFCTGTLHLFDMETIKRILSEIKRVLKNNGKLILDFATDISRLDSDNNPVVFNSEGNYTLEQGINIFKESFRNFALNIEKARFKEENLDKSAGYKTIEGNFLIISGECRDRIFEIEEGR